MKGEVYFEEIDGVCITADFSGKRVEDYAMAWLKLTNNAREFDDTILKIANNSGNAVYVYCPANREDIVREFLTDIITVTNRTETGCEFYTVGKVTYVEKCKIAIPHYDYPLDLADDDEEWTMEFAEMRQW